MPLEVKTVRFIDNFSAGTRGSISGEHFIQKEYAVLFLYRKRSLAPYERRFSNLNVLDLINYNDTNDNYKFDESSEFDYKSLFDTYKEVKENNLLLKIDYTSIYDYLSLLEYSCKAVKCLKRFDLNQFFLLRGFNKFG